MLKVCHMTSVHNSHDDRVFYKECRSLAANGYETYLVASGISREENGVHVIGLGNAPKSRSKRMMSFTKAVYKKALELDCDIYHFHDPELLPYGKKLKKQGKKVIFDSHENTAIQIAEKDYIPKPIRRIVSSIYRMYETSVTRQIDAVIVPCTFDRKNIFEGRAKKTVYISNYPKDALFSLQYDLTIERTYDFCYVGGLTYDRGIVHLVKAAGSGNLSLLLVGKFSSIEFEHQIRSMPEFENVTYLGVIPNTEIAKTMQSCKIGANTLLDVGQYYHFDTFGVKVVEYMSVGLPVIMNDSPYAKEMNNKYYFGMCVKPDNPKQIADAVHYLLANPEEARKMGENGRRAVEQEFNWNHEEKKLIQLYREVLC